MNLEVENGVVSVLKKGDKYLFIDYRGFHHPIHRGVVCFPDGKLNNGESLENAVSRELMIETRIRAHDFIYKGFVLFDNSDRILHKKRIGRNFLIHYFESSEFDESRAKSDEGKLIWLDKKEYLKVPKHMGDDIIIGWIEKYNFFEGEIKINGDEGEIERAALNRANR
jgi:8-oxo-dGTP pyrophosphatase MutT (NUDIX family)